MWKKAILIMTIVFMHMVVVLAQENGSAETFTPSNLADIRLIQQLQSRQDYMTNSYIVTAMAISPNSRRLLIQYADTAASSRDDLVQLWDLESFTLIREFHFESQPLTLRFSPDEQFFVSANSSSIHLVSAVDGKLRNVWENGYFSPGSVKFSLDGRILAFSDLELQKIVLWDIRDELEYTQFAYPNVTRVVFNPNATEFVFGNTDNQIFDCEIDADDQCILLWEGDESFGEFMFNRQGDTLAVDSLENVRVLEVDTGWEMTLIPNIWVNRFLMMRDAGDVVATASDRQIGFVNINTQETFAQVNEGEYLNDVDTTETFYATTKSGNGGSSVSVYIYQLADGEKLTEFPLEGLFTGMNLIAQFSPDNRYFIAARSDGHIQFWGVEGG